MPAPVRGLVVERWRDYGWVAITAKTKSGARKVIADVLARVELLLLEPGTKSRLAVDAAFATVGLRPSHVLELGAVEPQIAFALAGLGIAIVPLFAVPDRAVDRRKLSIS